MKIAPKQYATALLESLDENSGKKKEVAARFAESLIDDGQISKLKEIMEIFDDLWNKKNDLVKAEIISANSLSKEMQKSLKDLLTKISGGNKVEVTEKIDKHLLGGTILRYGDRILDLSLKNKIEKLKEDLNS
ncbi:MAG: ATP synthase F1 subunit delta [Patescibacteria group bacterium]|jgi:ATP synthase F1 delta subunit